MSELRPGDITDEMRQAMDTALRERFQRVPTHAAADYAGQVLAALEDGKPGAERSPRHRLRALPAA